MKNEATNFLNSTRPAGAFCEIAEITPETLRDWRKRKMVDFLGQPMPNGHWGYSLQDMMKVYLAKKIVGSGFSWRNALWMANVTTGYLTAEMQMHGLEGRERYTHRFVVFFQSGQRPDDALVDLMDHRAGDDLNDIVNEAFQWNAAHVSHVIDLVWTYNSLPARYRDGLNSLIPSKG